MAKGYSSGGVYKKSIRRGVDVVLGNLPIVKLLVSPFDKISSKIFLDCNFFIKFSKTILLLL